MDHPNSAPRFAWDSDRDTIMGHEFIGEVVGHGPDCSGDFPVGTRVTSLPIMIRPGEEPLVIGHNPDAPGAFGELMLVSEVMSRRVPDGVPNDSVALVDAFAVGEFYVRCSGIEPGELPLVIGAGAIGLSTVAALKSRGVSPIVVSDYSDERLAYAKTFGADVLVNPSSRDPYEVWRETFRANNFQTTQVIFECVGKNGLLQSIVDSCEFMARVYCRGRLVRRGHHRLHRCHAQGHDDPVRRRSAPAGLVRHAGRGRRRPAGSVSQHRQNHRPRRSARGHRSGAQRPGSAARRRASDRVMTGPSSAPRVRVLPGPIRQIGYVVDDLDRAIASWLELGVGPWFVMRGLPMRALYRGEPCETTLSFAWSNSGAAADRVDPASRTTRPASSPSSSPPSGAGFHQLAYWTDDFEATMEAVRAGRLADRLVGRRASIGVRFAYVEPAGCARRGHRDLRAHRGDGGQCDVHPRSRGRVGRQRSDPQPPRRLAS